MSVAGTCTKASKKLTPTTDITISFKTSIEMHVASPRTILTVVETLYSNFYEGMIDDVYGDWYL